MHERGKNEKKGNRLYPLECVTTTPNGVTRETNYVNQVIQTRARADDLSLMSNRRVIIQPTVLFILLLLIILLIVTLVYMNVWIVFHCMIALC